MKIGYIHLDCGEWSTDSYNVQEIGLAKALEQIGHQTTIVYLSLIHISEPTRH